MKPSAPSHLPTTFNTRAILDAALDGNVPTVAEAVHLLQLGKEEDLQCLRETADEMCKRQAGSSVGCTVGTSLYLTNLDELQPTIYSYPRNSGESACFVRTIDEIDGLLELAQARRARRLYVSGGGFWSLLRVPGLEKPTVLKTYARLLGYIRERLPEVRMEGFSPDEIEFLRIVSDRSERYVLEMLKDQGLMGLGGQHSGILADEVRRKVSMRLATVKRWFEIVEAAHRLGLPTVAHVEMGHWESLPQRVEHLDRLRTAALKHPGVFSSIRPQLLSRNPKSEADWPGLAHTALADRLKFQAVMRLMLGGAIPDQQVFWQPDEVAEAQECLTWGANSLGGTDALAWPAFLLDSRQSQIFSADDLGRMAREVGREADFDKSP